MKQLIEVFFDYTCPYCRRGVLDLLDLLPSFPQIDVCWVPCEAHPAPEPASVHSLLAEEALLAVEAQGGNVPRFHRQVYAAHFDQHRPIDDPQLLARIGADCGADQQRLLTALQQGTYRSAILENNTLVWDKLKLDAVPCYRKGNLLLKSQEDSFLSKDQLRHFLQTP